MTRCTLTHQTVPVCAVVIDDDTATISSVGEVYAPDHMPVGVGLSKGNVDRAALNDWWLGRSIPASRMDIDAALEQLGVAAPRFLIMKRWGLSLSDQYWMKPDGADLRWEDINFFDNPFSDDIGGILLGENVHGHEINMLSPDNTSDGWLKKRWVIVDGKRCLMKGGSGTVRQEPYNEALASMVCRRLNIPHIAYELVIRDDDPYCLCEDFITRDTELVTAWRVSQTRKRPNHASAYQHYLDCCGELGATDVPCMIDRMLALDYLIVNEDRHYNNFGLIRDAVTLSYISAAPIYDSGTSMWHDMPAAMIRPDGRWKSKTFRSYHNEQIQLVRSLDWLDISALHGIDEEFASILEGTAFIDDRRRDALCYGLRGRVELLKQHREDKRRAEAVI